MRAIGFLPAAIAVLFGAATAAAQQPIETRGAWRLVQDGEDFALRTAAVGAPDSTLSLSCHKEQQGYVLAIKSPALAARPSGEDIRISFKVDDSDQIWFNLSTGPDGTVPISHQTAFWIIYPALTRDEAKTIVFTAADYSWQFNLDGLRDLTAGLSKRCGFDPARREPERRRTSPSVPGAPAAPTR